MPVTYHFSHDAETMFQHLTDPDILVARSVALGDKDVDCEVEDEGRKTTVTLQRTVTRDLPAILAKLFSAENRITQVEKWESVGKGWTGTYTADVAGQPVTLTATFKLKPVGDGCEYSIDYKCKARIPMVGGKVEAFVLSQTETGLKQEMDFVRDYLRKKKKK
jgi:hypothetical protein